MPEPAANPPSTAILAFSRLGMPLGLELARFLKAELWVPQRLAAHADTSALDMVQTFDALDECMQRIFHTRTAHVFIGATGIAVRAIAPHVRSKATDPAVVVLDQNGKHCVSLLSGHLGGANALTRRIAEFTGAQAVITTGTDCAGLPAPDDLARKLELRASNIPCIKAVNALLLEGEAPQLYDPLDIFSRHKQGTRPLSHWFHPCRTPEAWNPNVPGVWIHWTTPPQNAFALHPPCLHAGLGCRRGTSAQEILTFLRTTVQEHGLAIPALADLSSIEAKADEPGLLQAADTLGLSLQFYPADRLSRVTTPTPSALVQQHMGVPSVCEAAAILSANNGPLILPKRHNNRITLAVAVSSWPDSVPETRTT
ncbi:cobalt-precorrin 5A acetaldehyde-lyase [Paucidesulfovibrio gracilis DSM 16080]|uniref:Cobalt-precorrin 5A acetaldehyde-lyase n=1 Tax=Paucidesulfovibrio gracilis DSM 16080 TaxID=1121449 RepID=A0A1T4X1U7_9BACT|nr:cobalamin biosynthesis protein [Paucidesulfovibrio gracilis]SKA83623.1 cobalt-precorrin 5A acetaldehyde-lyase [Paucidesulfovibrio gracilis DSM 16080]